MKNGKQIYKENITLILRRFTLLLFMISMFVFMFYGVDYMSVLKGDEDIQFFGSQLSHEDPSNLNGTYVSLDANHIQNYYVAFQNKRGEDYYYLYQEPSSQLLLTLKVNGSRKDEFETLVSNGGSISLKGSLSFLNDAAVDVGKLTIENDGQVVGDDIWKYVSPYVVNVDKLSVFSISTTKFIFYASLSVSILCIGLYVYLKTDSWLNNEIMKKELKLIKDNEEAQKELREVKVISRKDNRVLLGKNYLFYKDSFYRNKYQETKVKDIRWIKIKKFALFIVQSDYVFLSVDHEGNERILLVAKGKKEMQNAIDKIIRENDKIILGEIKELKEKNLSLKNHKEETMKIVNQIYKDNVYDYMKEDNR